MSKHSVDVDIHRFLELWPRETLVSFLSDVVKLFELYNVDDQDDWVADEVGQENVQNVRFIRTVYLISRIAELHAGKLCKIKIELKELYRRMENLIEKKSD